MSKRKDIDKVDSRATLNLERRENETAEGALARNLLKSEIHAGQTIRHLSFKDFGETGITELVDHLEKLTSEAKSGATTNAEGMLAAQAHTLDILFNRLAQQAAVNMGSYLEATVEYLKLAMRAQTQCRATLETLVEIKRPRELIRQTNIAHGHQQVNNCPERDIPQNELLEDKDGERLDTRTPQEAVRGD